MAGKISSCREKHPIANRKYPMRSHNAIRKQRQKLLGLSGNGIYWNIRLGHLESMIPSPVRLRPCRVGKGGDSLRSVPYGGCEFRGENEMRSERFIRNA